MSKGEVTVKPATLRAFRKKEGLSQAALAAKATEYLKAKYPDDPDAGVSESLVALVETGRRNPSRDNAEAFAFGVDVPLEALADVAEPVIAAAVPA